MCQRPLTLTLLSPPGSVDGHALQIDRLKGTKPTKRIDLSHKGLGVASVIIIGELHQGERRAQGAEVRRRPSVVRFCVNAR